MNTKRLILSRFYVVVICSFFFTGCQPNSSGLGDLLSPKRKVPPVEEISQEEVFEEEVFPPGEQAPVKESLVTEVDPAGLFEHSEGTAPAGQPLFTELPDPQYVAGRLAHYQEKLSRWQALESSFSGLDLVMSEPQRWRQCVGLIEELFAGYGFLEQMPTRRTRFESGEVSPLSVCQLDISYLESDCETLFAASASVVSGQLQKYRGIVAGQAAAVVNYWAGRQEHDKVILSYENLLSVAREEEVDMTSREHYATALKAGGRLQEAAAIFIEVAEIRGELEGWPLRLQGAELLFAQGDYRRSQQQFLQVGRLLGSMEKAQDKVKSNLELLAGQDTHARELELYRKALHGWFVFDGKSVPSDLAESVHRLELDFPGSNYTRMGRVLFDQAGGNIERYVEQEVQQAKRLAAENNFTQALEILSHLQQQSYSEDLVALVQGVEEEIKIVQAQELERAQIEKMEAFDAKWQNGVHLLDQRRYDQAIALFEELINSKYRDQAMEKMSTAVNLAASELRKEAANLFVKSRKVEHPEKKGALLLQSRRLLLLIQEKYPGADIIGKVKQNQRAIEEQIRIFDADLLDE